jgi:hypothetical protein
MEAAVAGRDAVAPISVLGAQSRVVHQAECQGNQGRQPGSLEGNPASDPGRQGVTPSPSQ